MNNYDEKSYEQDGTVTYTKCSNININIAGLELNELPSSLAGLASEAQAADEARDSSSFGNGRSNGPSGSDNGFVCIIKNNNNNVAGGGGNGESPCDGCFAKLSDDLQTAIDTFMGTSDDITIAGIPATTVTIPADVDTIGELCIFLNAHPINFPQNQLKAIIEFFAFASGSTLAIATD